MDEKDPLKQEAKAPSAKKKYQKPAFRSGRVFEVSALSCGKISSSQSSCHNNLKIS